MLNRFINPNTEVFIPFAEKNLEPPKRGPFLLLWPFEAPRGYREMLKTRDFARREEGDVRFGGYLPFTMVREIFLRSRSIFSTHTLTVSPTRTTSLGCLTKRLASLEICTRPS